MNEENCALLKKTAVHAEFFIRLTCYKMDNVKNLLIKLIIINFYEYLSFYSE